MSRDRHHQEQDENTGKLVMSAFYRVADKDGATAEEITIYLQEKFGDVWKTSTLTGKAEEALKRSAELGFLEQHGSKYVENMARDYRGRTKRRRKKPCKRCYRKTPRPRLQ